LLQLERGTPNEASIPALNRRITKCTLGWSWCQFFNTAIMPALFVLTAIMACLDYLKIIEFMGSKQSGLLVVKHSLMLGVIPAGRRE